MADDRIDQVSQILGAQGAQLTSLTGAIGELKAEILQNRMRAENHREREMKEWDEVKAELRNVKHDYRDTQQKSIATQAILSGVNARLLTIETKIATWRGQVSVLVGLSGFVGVVLGALAEPFVTHVLPRLFN